MYILYLNQLVLWAPKGCPATLKPGTFQQLVLFHTWRGKGPASSHSFFLALVLQTPSQLDLRRTEDITFRKKG